MTHPTANASRLGMSTKQTARTYALNSIGPVVYAARMADGTIKFGHTSRLGRRLWDLAYREQMKAELLAFRPGTYEDEQALHQRLAPHLHHGREWYHPTSAVMSTVNEMRDGFGLPRLTVS